MRRFLLPENGQFYKANLHCHTTVSDGKMTPEEVKERYLGEGYSIVAFTDHCVLIPHPELKDERFLPLNGVEIEVVNCGTEPAQRKKHNHICYVALEEDNVTMPFLSPGCIWGNAKQYVDRIKYDPAHAEFKRRFEPENINEMIRLGREADFFVTYNHPVWSQEYYEDYIHYQGMNAMEILNYGSYHAGFDEYNGRIYDDLLLAGKRIYCIATDDNHSLADTCGGWTMIKADRLEYRMITKAMEDGHFYASTGPEIHALWWEDGVVHVECSEASKIICHIGPFRPYFERAKDTPLTEADFEIRKEDVYFRITVVDEQGRKADTNAYFTDELFEMN